MCWAWWCDEIRPRLGEALRLLPACVMPSVLLDRFVDESMMAQVDASARSRELVRGSPVELLLESAVTLMVEVDQGLRCFVSTPSELSRNQALMSTRALVSAMRDLPRNIVLP